MPESLPVELPAIVFSDFPITRFYSGSAGNNCSGNSTSFFNGFHKVHEFTPVVSENVDINLITESSTAGIFIYNSCEDIGVNCAASSSNSNSHINSISHFNVIAGQTYYIAVGNSPAAKEYMYTLTITPSNACDKGIQAGFGVTNCTKQQFYVTANIQSLDGSLSVEAKVLNHGVQVSSQLIYATGIVQFGPFASNDEINIILQKPQTPSCFIISSLLRANDCITGCVPTQGVVTVGNLGNCNYTLGTLVGNKLTDVPLQNCSPAPLVDAWYTFVATSAEQHIQLTNSTGGSSNLKFAVYRDNCPGVTQLYCSNQAQGTVTGLTVGQTYKIRVYATSFADISGFRLCVTGTSVVTCANNNAQFPIIKGLYINLLNHLIANRTAVQAAGNGYTCAQLTALMPYIWGANANNMASINNFTVTANTISFDFYNIPNQIGHQVTFSMPQNGSFISDFAFSEQLASSQELPTDVFFFTTNAQNNNEYFTPYTSTGHISFIDFCTNKGSLCSPEITGYIEIAGGLSCMGREVAYELNFITDTPGITSYEWKFRGPIDFYSGFDSQFEALNGADSVTTVPRVGVYFAEENFRILDLTVTQADGCKQTLHYFFRISDNCSDKCTETNPNVRTVKSLYLGLVNHLLDLYPGPGVTLPYTCPQLTALAPYLADTDPKIYSMDYNNVTGMLSVSFGQHAGYDLVIKDRGIPVSDIELFDFDNPEIPFSVSTIYNDGQIVNQHTLRHVKFCSANIPCEGLTASILMNNSPACMLQGTTNIISYIATSQVSGTEWKLTKVGEQTPRVISSDSSIEYTFSALGTYTIELTLALPSGCTKTFTRTVTVYSQAYCPVGCGSATFVNVDPSGDCEPVTGNFNQGFLSPSTPICGDTPVAEVWYGFEAFASTQHVQLSGLGNLGTNLKYAIYSGECPEVSFLQCADASQTTLYNLTIGNYYYIRIYTTSAVNQSLDFELCVTATLTTCADTSPNGPVVKGLLVNLINHLITNAPQIMEAGVPYTCNELTALAPYISDANPKIYNFQATPSSLSFNFSNHGTTSYDVVVSMQNPGYIAGFEFMQEIGTGATNVRYLQDNVDTTQNHFYATNNIGHVKHINFCASPTGANQPCSPQITGDIFLNNGASCITVGQNTIASFSTTESNVTVAGWVVTSYDGTYNVILPAANSATITFPSAGNYYVKAIVTKGVLTTCTGEIIKTVTVHTTCTGVNELSCPQNDALVIKHLYIDLINYLLERYPASPVPAEFTCAQLTALEPFISEPNPKIYNATYNYTTNSLHFSFGNHAGYDVVVKDYGVPVADIDISGFTVANTSFTANTVYANGLTDIQHAIRRIKFCEMISDCPQYSVNVVMPNSGSCIPIGTATFTYLSTTPSVSGVSWRLFSGNQATGTPLATGTSTTGFSYNFTTAGTYTISLGVSYSSSCSRNDVRTFTVSAPGTCTTSCQQAANLPVSQIGDCQYTDGSFANASLSTIPLTNCAPAPLADAWYQFVATSVTHYIQLTGLNGLDTTLKFALYTGSCNNLTQVYCSNNLPQTMVNNLIPGETYMVRVYTTSSYTPDNFRICNSAAVPTCADTNPNSSNVKQLFTALVNNLLQNRNTIPTNSGYSCPELTALAQYITVSNPKVYNFVVEPTKISFNFSNQPSSTGTKDVVINLPAANVYFASFEFASAFNVESTTNIKFVQDNSSTLNGFFTGSIGGLVRYVNFCPAVNCGAITGIIRTSQGESCVIAGSDVVFSFSTDIALQQNKTWVLTNATGTIVATSVSPDFLLTNITATGMYTLKATVRTQSGCSETFYKEFEIKATCDAHGCTEQNPNTIKGLYIALINKLLALYPQNPITTPSYTSDELEALLPYINNEAEAIYNINYNPSTQMLSFSFGNHTGYDVIVKDIGVPVSNVMLSGFTSADQAFVLQTIYNNGHVESTHSVKQVDFCMAVDCPAINASIEMADGISCVMQGSEKRFYFQTTATNISSYTWKFLGTDNSTVLFTQSNISNLDYTYAAPGDYLIKLDVQYNNGCEASFYKAVTVLPTGATPACADFCTETNSLSGEVKQKYIALLNRIITTCLSGNTITNGTGTSEITMLQPYIEDSEPAIYNLVYNADTRMAKFSFAPHGVNHDVEFYVPSIVRARIGTIYYNIPYCISDVDILNYNPDVEALQSLKLVYGPVRLSNLFPPIVSPLHKVRHLEFCPQFECVHHPGAIALETGLSCAQTTQSINFRFAGDITHISEYVWTFYDEFGSMIGGEVREVMPSKRYDHEGNYVVKLSVKLDNGCVSTYTKTITVSDTCPSFCTETNEISGTVSNAFIAMVNDVFMQQSFPQAGYLSNQVDDMIPFITDNNPRIYNASYSGQTLSFSFSQHSGPKDVVIKNYGMVTDINFVGYTTSASYTTAIISYANGSTATAQIKHVNFCPEEPECKKHISFVFDESGSISEEEASYIKMQMAKFVQQQYDFDAETYISFIGMSDSDNDTRHDHKYHKVSTLSEVEDFKNWLTTYKTPYTASRTALGISANSDYWASALKVAMTQTIRPDVVVIITDGSQTANLQGLKNIIRDVRTNSHLYVYGIGSGSYVNLNPLHENANTSVNVRSEVTGKLIASLKYLFELAPTDFPVSNQTRIDQGDFFEHANFEQLALDPTYFSDKMALAEYGCGGAVTPKTYCDDCETFQPKKGEYFITGWVKEQSTLQVRTYTNAVVWLHFYDSVGNRMAPDLDIKGSGDIIDGWQRFEKSFTIPEHTSLFTIELLNDSANIPVFFDDIRLHPLDGSMKTFVYDPETFKLAAELDDNNYSTFYEYDKEGSLIRIKKETSQGIKTIQESRSGNVIQPIQH